MKYIWLNSLVFYCFILLSIGCGGGSGGSEVPSPQTPSPPANLCGVLAANETCITLTSPDDFSNERYFILNVPHTASSSAPIFILLHGSGGRANSTADRFQFREFVEKNGYIGLFANAIIRGDGVSTWNAHNATYGVSHINDVKFIQKAIAEVVSTQNADAEKVFVFGWSNGGFMANRLACESPENITAIFTLAGNLRDTLEHCDTSAKVAIHHLHPTGDTAVPFYGDSSKGYISAEEAINRWVTHHHCQSAPITAGPFDLTADEAGEESNAFLYQGCNAPVEFTVVDGSDHGPDFHIDTLHQYLTDFYNRASQ